MGAGGDPQMKKLLLASLALTVLTWGDAAAQTAHTESVTKRKGPGPNTKVKTEIVTGKVTEYEPGKDIEIEGPGGDDFEFDLDEGAKVEGAIVVGQTATVRYTKGDAGKKSVVVLSGTAMSGKDPHAQAHQTQPAPGGRAHVESETKRTGPGPNSKVKTEIVVGTVKEYEAGEKITVTGPKDNDHSFDLDEDVTVKGAIVKGQQVRVEFTKGEDGTERVTIVSPAAAAKTSKKSKG